MRQRERSGSVARLAAAPLTPLAGAGSPQCPLIILIRPTASEVRRLHRCADPQQPRIVTPDQRPSHPSPSPRGTGSSPRRGPERRSPRSTPLPGTSLAGGSTVGETQLGSAGGIGQRNGAGAGRNAAHRRSIDFSRTAIRRSTAASPASVAFRRQSSARLPSLRSAASSLDTATRSSISPICSGDKPAVDRPQP